MWLANMSFCVNWGHFPGSIVSAQGNTLPSMEDLGATTGSFLKTMNIMSQVILEGSSTGIFVMGFHGYIQARTIQLIAHSVIKAR